MGLMDRPMERDEVECYWLGGIQFVPHYVAAGIFVAPGGITKSETELLSKGAVASKSYLWPRPWQKRRAKSF